MDCYRHPIVPFRFCWCTLFKYSKKRTAAVILRLHTSLQQCPSNVVKVLRNNWKSYLIFVTVSNVHKPGRQPVSVHHCPPYLPTVAWKHHDVPESMKMGSGLRRRGDDRGDDSTIEHGERSFLNHNAQLRVPCSIRKNFPPCSWTFSTNEESTFHDSSSALCNSSKPRQFRHFVSNPFRVCDEHVSQRMAFETVVHGKGAVKKEMERGT